MNVRSSVHTGDEACKRGIQVGQGQTSLEVQKGGIIGSTKRTDALQNLKEAIRTEQLCLE